MDNYHAMEQCKEWIANFVIKHNICPFAHHVFDADKIGYITELSESFEDLALSFLTKIAQIKYETAFFIYRDQFPDFLEFLDFYYACEAILEDSEYDDQYQIVAFHPDYTFAGEDADDPSNLTNRSPHPMIHILRRDHVERAVDAHGDVESIPKRNIEYLRKLHS